MPTIYVNIGSNNGDRHALIEQAVAAIYSAFPNALIRKSDYIESEPWGFVSHSRFLNLGLAITDQEHVNVASDVEAEVDGHDGDAVMKEYALTVLDRLHEIEIGIDASPHRDKSGSYIDRKIDIDIIAIDDIVIDTPQLQLPHPRMHLRDFVLIPMRQLAPEWRHPLLGNVYQL